MKASKSSHYLQDSLSLTSRNWWWYLVPMNASCSGLSIIIQIYMLSLGGQVREVAMAVFLSNLAVTLGAVFWGKLIDAMHWLKTIVDICSAAVAITAASIFFISSTPLLMLTSALVGFFSVGPAPVTNLLVMEKSRREDWLKTYNWTSLISAVGPVVAMLAGYVWLMEYSAQTYAIVCSAIAVSSLVLTVMFVQDSPATLKRRAMVRLPAVIYRPKQVPMMFLKPVFDLSISKLRASVSKKEFLFFAGTGLYFLSGNNLMFTPYTPFLKDSGVTDSGVFLAYTILHLSRVFFLPFNHGIVAKTRRRKDEPACIYPEDVWHHACCCGRGIACRKPYVGADDDARVVCCSRSGI